MRKLILFIGLALLVGAPFYFFFEYAREMLAFNPRTISNGAEIAHAFHRYHEKNGHFPPAYTVESKGQKLHSWRTLLLEWIALIRIRRLGYRNRGIVFTTSNLRERFQFAICRRKTRLRGERMSTSPTISLWSTRHPRFQGQPLSQ
jgi:hypothetical protein